MCQRINPHTHTSTHLLVHKVHSRVLFFVSQLVVVDAQNHVVFGEFFENT